MKPANWQPPEPQILAEMQRQSEHGSFS